MRLFGLCLFFLCQLAHSQYKTTLESEKYIKLKKNRYFQEGYFVDGNSERIVGLIKVKPKKNKDVEKLTFVFPSGHSALIYLKHIKSFGFMDKRFEIENKIVYEVFEFEEPIELLKVSSDAWNTYGQSPAPGAEQTKYKEQLFIRLRNDPKIIEVPRKEFESFYNTYLKNCQLEKSIPIEIQFSNILFLVKGYNSCKKPTR